MNRFGVPGAVGSGVYAREWSRSPFRAGDQGANRWRLGGRLGTQLQEGRPSMVSRLGGAVEVRLRRPDSSDKAAMLLGSEFKSQIATDGTAGRHATV